MAGAIHNEIRRFQENLWRMVDIVLPPRCPVTGDIVDRQGMVAPSVWKELNFISAPYCEGCGVPFGFETDSGSRCTDCLTYDPPYKTARAPLVYDDASRDIILKYKHADKIHAVHSFLPWLKQSGKDMLADADVLVPVPLHHFRLIRRRYNQSAILAQALSKESGIPVSVDALLRTRPTPVQGHLGYKERKKNVRKAFKVNPQRVESLKDKKVVLVDDVYTTGATVKECCKSLLADGVLEVHVLTIARVRRGEMDF